MPRSAVISSRIAPVSRISPNDQLAMTHAPMIPASGSIQSQPKLRASNRPTMTSTDTAASAMT